MNSINISIKSFISQDLALERKIFRVQCQVAASNKLYILTYFHYY